MTTTSVVQEVSRPAVDYIESWYAGDAERMAAALHPEAGKRYLRTVAPGLTHLEECGASKLVSWTASGQGANVPPEHQAHSVTVLDHVDWERGTDIATVKVEGATGVEYLQEAQFGSRWQIVNILSSPRTAPPFHVRLFEATAGQLLQGQAKDAAVEGTVRKAALDYMVGWVTGDRSAVTEAVHPQLLKRGVRVGQHGEVFLETFGSSKLSRWTGFWTKSDPGRVDLRVLDCTDDIAAVRVDWNFEDNGNYSCDCICLGRVDGKWKVVNLLFPATGVADGDWTTWEW